jgi:hypothetical protein
MVNFALPDRVSRLGTWLYSAGDTAKEILYIALLKWAVSRCHTAVVLFQKPPTTLEGLFFWGYE